MLTTPSPVPVAGGRPMALVRRQIAVGRATVPVPTTYVVAPQIPHQQVDHTPVGHAATSGAHATPGSHTAPGTHAVPGTHAAPGAHPAPGAAHTPDARRDGQAPTPDPAAAAVPTLPAH